jgi:hypothetical protein
MDSDGLYVQGGYGIRLYLNLTIPLGAGVKDGAPLHAGGAPTAPQKPPGLYQTKTAGTNGVLTDPMMPDTDGDGLKDGSEVFGVQNPYKAHKYNANFAGGNTDPTRVDTDGDSIGDGKELGVGVNGVAWVMDPNSLDTDGDSRPDKMEDAGQDGSQDLIFRSFTGVWEKKSSDSTSSPVDGDTDDDGVSDLEEADRAAALGLDPLNWDSDHDGLSDGLELGKTDIVSVSGSTLNPLGIPHTLQGRDVFGLTNWPTFQRFPTPQESPGSYGAGAAAITTLVNKPDSDADGILDGLEDLNHNGRFGDYNGAFGGNELKPKVDDTDGDGILDGRELLVAGTYSFQDFVNARGNNPAAAMAYDGALLKTDPTKLSTDADSPGHVIPDGKDINPKGDGLMFLQLDRFWQYDPIDVSPCWNNDCSGNYATDLVLGITLETGVGDFTVQTTELSNFGKMDGAAFAQHGLSLATKRNPTPPLGWSGALNAIDMTGDAGDTIKFDLPDHIDDFTRAKDMKIHVRVDAVDRDGSDFHDDDVVDISQDTGRAQYWDAAGVDMTAGSPLVEYRAPTLDANGNGDRDEGWTDYSKSTAGDHDDGRLLMNFHANLVPYFLKNILGTPTPLGICFAGVDSQGRSCVI